MAPKRYNRKEAVHDRKTKVPNRGSELLADRTFELIMSRFDSIDHDNAQMKLAMLAHSDKDSQFYKQVERHSTYWSLLVGGVTVIGASVMAWINGLLK